MEERKEKRGKRQKARKGWGVKGKENCLFFLPGLLYGPDKMVFMKALQKL